MPAAFAVYLASVYAFSFLGPFGYPAGRDLAGGVLAELSGPDRLVLQAGRWLLLTAGAAMAVPLFLGGGAGPLLPRLGVVGGQDPRGPRSCWCGAAAGCRCSAPTGTPSWRGWC